MTTTGMQEWRHITDRICKSATYQDERPVGRCKLIIRMHGQVEEAGQHARQVFTGNTAYVRRFLHGMVDIEGHIHTPMNSLHVPHATCHNWAPSYYYWWLSMRRLLF